MNHILNKEDVTEIAAPIIYYILSNRRNDGLLLPYFSTFGLICLSCKRIRSFVYFYPINAQW